MSVSPTAVIVLAAGEGTRMKSTMPKVLHPICGKSLVGHALTAARELTPQHLAVVVRHERDRVAAHVSQVAPEAVIADQDDVKGTGRAAECGLLALPPGLTGTVLVTYGDVPLLTSQTLEAMLAQHVRDGCAVTVITASIPDPTGYGRILRDADGAVSGIVEQKDASPAQQGITEINSGIYAFDAQLLSEALAEVGTDNAQGEKYLTDVIGIARRRGLAVQAHLIDDLWQTEGVNDREQLARLGAELNRRVGRRWMREGVTLVDPETIWIDADVSIGADCTILPGTQLLGATTIGNGVVIGPDCTLRDVEVGDRATLVRTHAELAAVGADATVGPFVHLAPNATVEVGATVAAFTHLGGKDTQA
ncbi:MAG: NTP transferase domain-containing protein [Austwickia sp.]|nr:NTP transferase domain-containing protein [Austwickia sp.]MBK9101872.1 NTP transferase domain-containing protein [Austwickia sp.]